MENTDKYCCLCGSKVTLYQVREKWICDECLQIGNEKHSSLWKESIERLIYQYYEACYQCIASDEPENIYKARSLGRKSQSVLQFIGLPKNHALLIPIRKVNVILKKIGQANMLLDEIEEQNEENNVNAEMVKLLSIKQKKVSERLTDCLPNLINDSYLDEFRIFSSEELNSYLQLLQKEKALQQFEERINELVEAYGQSADIKGKNSAESIKLLHKIRIKAKHLSSIYSFLKDVFSEMYQDKENYYKDIQRQIGKVEYVKDWLDHLKTYKKKISAPKKEKTAIKNKLKGRIDLLIENVELHPVYAKES